MERPIKIDYMLNYSLIKKDLEEDCKYYEQIKKRLFDKRINKEKIIIYHPGARDDFLTMLAIYDSAVNEKNKHAEFIFLDTRDFTMHLIKQIKKYLHNPIIMLEKKKDKKILRILLKNKTINITYYTADFCKFFPPELKTGIDIYYERAFEMFRTNDNISTIQVYLNLTKGGLMISDYGFNLGKFEKMFKKIKGIPVNFGFYKNFQIWKKTG